MITKKMWILLGKKQLFHIIFNPARMPVEKRKSKSTKNTFV